MKINFILPGLGDSGGIKVALIYAKLISNHGHDVIIYSQIKGYNLGRYDKQMINKVHQLYCTLKTISQYVNSKKRKKCDICYVYQINNKSIRDADVTVATAWCTAYDVANLNTSKGKKYYFIQDFEIWDNQKNGLESYSLPLRKIVISSWINSKLEEYTGKGNYPVVYNGIDIEKFKNPRKKYKRKGEKITCLMLNHSLIKKGVQYGMEAFENARKIYTNLELIMFGQDAPSNIPKYITYVQDPSQDKIVSLYCSADIFIFPSLEEGWGLTPIEAMACKCAVVGTRTGFVLDIGINGENILISKPMDTDGMSTNILKLINDSQLIRKISENGYRTACMLDWNKSCAKLEQIFFQNLT